MGIEIMSLPLLPVLWFPKVAHTDVQKMLWFGESICSPRGEKIITWNNMWSDVFEHILNLNNKLYEIIQFKLMNSIW